jgi:hypothetical protein
MDSKDVEANYAQVIFGQDEPDLMVCNGALLKEMSAKEGHPVTHDAFGQEIIDGLVYHITAKGIYPVRVEPEDEEAGLGNHG